MRSRKMSAAERKRYLTKSTLPFLHGDLAGLAEFPSTENWMSRMLPTVLRRATVISAVFFFFACEGWHLITVGSFDTSYTEYDIELMGDLAYVADGDFGLRVIDLGPEYRLPIAVEVDIRPGSDAHLEESEHRRASAYAAAPRFGAHTQPGPSATCWASRISPLPRTGLFPKQPGL